MPTFLKSTIDNRISKGIITVADRDKMPVVQKLLVSSEPSVRWKIRRNVLQEDINSKKIKKLQADIKGSERVRKLLSERDRDGRIPYHPYAKWYGAHWVLSLLADLGYPPNDKSLIPLREQAYQWLLPNDLLETFNKNKELIRIHGSIEGNLIYSLFTLGLADERIEILVQRLLQSQWPDGGWNCDKKPQACHSSFHETLIPLRGLYLYAKTSGNRIANRAVEWAAEVFLQRHLFRRKTNGRIIRPQFLLLHYPCYWHYDILFGLKVLAETNFIQDTRCNEALDFLESKRLPDGGFPAENKYYNFSKNRTSGFSIVDWGGISKRKMNEFVTADALYVLRAAGRQ